ncbi:hypothetical protein Acr_15g0005400 [Actinidia rufa]|uniref:RNase H type-1 domain-containing protein n=1 Tax=Actinidia rufa TaxID=165716 RepID=A0A7J0FTB9_9ERIC|nr:hypothetical protein Acr_15g0005400 [Actinidia rufa]
MTQPDPIRAGTPDELPLQSNLGGPLRRSSVQTPFDTSLARTEVSTNCRHGASSETLCARSRSSHHHRRMPFQAKAIVTPEAPLISKLETTTVLKAWIRGNGRRIFQGMTGGQKVTCTAEYFLIAPMPRWRRWQLMISYQPRRRVMAGLVTCLLTQQASSHVLSSSIKEHTIVLTKPFLENNSNGRPHCSCARRQGVTSQTLKRRMIHQRRSLLWNLMKKNHLAEEMDQIYIGSESKRTRMKKMSVQLLSDLRVVAKEPNPPWPSFTLSKEELRRVRKPWRKALIIKLMGRSIGYRVLCQRLEISKIGDAMQPMKRIEGTIQRFKNGKRSSDQYLHMEYFDTDVLMEMGNEVGKAIKAVNSIRGKFARVCVELDLNARLVPVVRMNEIDYNVEYEGLHLICFECGMYGHKTEYCDLGLVRMMELRSPPLTPDWEFEMTLTLPSNVMTTLEKLRAVGLTEGVCSRGAGNPQTIRNVCEMVHFHDPVVLVLLEPRVASHRAQTILAVQILPSSTQTLNAMIRRQREVDWLFTAVYASPNPAVWEELWEYLAGLAGADSIIEQVEKCNRTFLWGGTEDRRKIHLVAWKDICCPNSDGGLGLHDLNAFNKAMLGKNAGKIFNNHGSLWVRVIRSKCLANGKTVWDKLATSASQTWKSFYGGTEILQRGLRWQLGNRRTIRFWTDLWLLSEPLLHYALHPISETNWVLNGSDDNTDRLTWSGTTLREFGFGGINDCLRRIIFLLHIRLFEENYIPPPYPISIILRLVDEVRTAGYELMLMENVLPQMGLWRRRDLLRNDRGEWLGGFQANLGRGFSIQAELWSLWLGLNLAHGMGVPRTIMETDSEKVTNLVCSDSSLSPHQNILSDIRQLMGQNWNCNVSRIYRKANHCADHRAHEALSMETGFVNLCSPPANLMFLFWQDILGPGNARLSSV